MIWDALTYLLIGNRVGPTPLTTYPGSSRTSRYLSRRRIACPLLFFPLSWMILSNSVQIPSRRWVQGVGGSQTLPFPSMSTVIHTMNATDTYQRVQSVDEMVMLDFGTLMQCNKIKFTVLLDGIAALNPSLTLSESEAVETVLDDAVAEAADDEFFESFEEKLPAFKVDHQVVVDDDTLQTFMDPEESAFDDDPYDPFNFHLLGPDRTRVNCVWESGEQQFQRLEACDDTRTSEGNGPLTIAAPSLANITAHPVLAFPTFGDSGSIKHPIIFDTGASLAITPDQLDFDGPMSVPTGDLLLGGMANVLRIEGIGTVTWTFANLDGTEVRISGLAYYVPGEKARLLSPQRLFDGVKVKGHYEGDHKDFR